MKTIVKMVSGSFGSMIPRRSGSGPGGPGAV
jgi:hypothetical protein